MGAIIRNDNGLVMAAFSQPIPLPTFVETVEVLAARSAVCLARELNLDQVIFEGDAEVIIKALNNGGFSSSSFGHIIRDIKLLSSAFNKVSFSHTRRQGNRVAHGLARMACNFSTFQVWMEDVPPDLNCFPFFWGWFLKKKMWRKYLVQKDTPSAISKINKATTCVQN